LVGIEYIRKDEVRLNCGWTNADGLNNIAYVHCDCRTLWGGFVVVCESHQSLNATRKIWQCQIVGVCWWGAWSKLSSFIHTVHKFLERRVEISPISDRKGIFRQHWLIIWQEVEKSQTLSHRIADSTSKSASWQLKISRQPICICMRVKRVSPWQRSLVKCKRLNNCFLLNS